MSDLDLQPEEGLDSPIGDMSNIGGDNELPPMDDEKEEPNDGDGTQNKDNDDEGIEIYNSLPIEKKSAAIKYMKSMQNDSESNEKDNENPMESKKTIDHLVNEIANGIINDFDMNDRNGEKGTKRYEKKISNKNLNRKNPFVSGR